MTDYIVIGKEDCPHCVKAKAMLDECGADYVYTTLDSHVYGEMGGSLIALSDQKTFPFIFSFVGGASDLQDSLTKAGFIV